MGRGQGKGRKTGKGKRTGKGKKRRGQQGWDKDGDGGWQGIHIYQYLEHFTNTYNFNI